VLIVIDTLATADMGVYQPDLDTTPNLSEVASQGTLFLDARSPAPWTMPATASLFTSRYPATHGVLRFGDNVRSDLPRLADLLQRTGYETLGAVGNGLLRADRGFAAGFDQWKVFEHDEFDARHLSDQARQWLGARAGGRPFFLYLHFMDPHPPYTHHEEFHRTSSSVQPGLASTENLAELRHAEAEENQEDMVLLRELYREEIAYTDFQIGRVWEYLRDSGLAEETLVVVAADHGEEFREHGELGHGFNLYRTALRVPLIIRQPGVAPAVVDGPVSLLDVAPTILDLVGEGPEALAGKGRSLATLLGSPAQQEPRLLFAETIWGEEIPIVQDLLQPDPSKQDSSDWIPPLDPPPSRAALRTSVTDGRWKLIHDQINEWWELYDLRTDPGERVNLFGGHPEEQRLREGLLDWEREVGANPAARLRRPEALELEPDEIEQLRALGYVG
jgi:arylsulfatase A-like enzyme